MAELSPQDHQNQKVAPLIPRTIWLWAVGLFLFQMALIALYVYPSYAMRDSPLFIMVAASGGIAHPPGSPTWAALATVAVRLIPYGDWALRTNLFCGILGAFTIAGLYINAWLLVRRILPDLSDARSRIVALTAPAVLNCSPGWWVQCTTTEQYTLMTAFLVVIAGLAWRIERAEGRPFVWLFVVLGILWGLAAGNHMSQLALGPFIAVLGFVGWKAGGIRMVALRGVGAAAGFCVGISIYFWTYFRSLTNPLIDTGNVKSWDRFLWLVSREQWPSRPSEEIPLGFAWEWIKSYHLISELSIAGVALAVAGLVIIGRRKWPMLLFWALLFIPYGYGMLHAHRSQAGMAIDYIDVYGVYDWHVALYLWLAIATVPAMGFLWKALEERSPQLARGLVAVLLVMLGINGIISGYYRSRHNSADPRGHTAALMEPLPENALVMLSSDNLAFAIGHEMALEEAWSDKELIWASPTFPNYVANRIDGSTTGTLDQSFLRGYIQDRGLNPNLSPLRYPTPSVEELLTRPIFCDYSIASKLVTNWFNPRGFLYEFTGEPFSEEEVRASYEEWNREYAPTLLAPMPTANDQDRRGWAELWERRAIFYFERGLYDLAHQDILTAIQWLPERARQYTLLGQCLDYLGDGAAARVAYEKALEVQPLVDGARLFLALSEAREGRLAEAIRLLDAEARISPFDDRIAPLRERMAADLEQRQRGQ